MVFDSSSVKKNLQESLLVGTHIIQMLDIDILHWLHYIRTVHIIANVHWLANVLVNTRHAQVIIGRSFVFKI